MSQISISMLSTCPGSATTDNRTTVFRNGFPHYAKNGTSPNRRYEAGTSQPTLDVIRKLAQALRVSADELLFETAERGPDEDLRLQFEAISRFTDDEKKVVKSVLEGLLLTHEARKWSAGAAIKESTR